MLRQWTIFKSTMSSSGITEMERSSFCPFLFWVNWNMSFCQLPVLPITKFHQNHNIPVLVITLMAQNKTEVATLLMHWSYCSPVLSHQYVSFQRKKSCVTILHKIGKDLHIGEKSPAVPKIRLWMSNYMDSFIWNFNYRQVSNIRRTLVRNKLVDHSDVVGASPVGVAPTTSSWST